MWLAHEDESAGTTEIFSITWGTRQCQYSKSYVAKDLNLFQANEIV